MRLNRPNKAHAKVAKCAKGLCVLGRWEIIGDSTTFYLVTCGGQHFLGSAQATFYGCLHGPGFNITGGRFTRKIQSIGDWRGEHFCPAQSVYGDITVSPA